MEKPKNRPRKKPQQPFNAFAAYSSLGIQMAVIIGGAAWLGDYLDETYQTNTPVYTIVLSILGVGAGLYIALKGVIKRSRKDE